MNMLPFYWLLPHEVAAGPYPGSPDAGQVEEKLRWLVGQGIRGFADLTEPGEITRFGPLVGYGPALEAVGDSLGTAVDRVSFPIPDLSVPSPETMVSILDAMDERLAHGAAVYVHCLGGRGRTGVVLGCYLVRHASDRLGTADRDEAARRALAMIVRERTEQRMPYPGDSPQTSAQFERVRSWEIGR